jgi:S-DNA-T family DNA segregation ATPase FtsK/SpoIIIE
MCGDALFKDGDSDAIRLEVPCVRDETVKQIIDSAIAQYPGREFIIGHSFVTLKNKDLESMYSRALDLVRTTRRASTSWFQRQLNIGYNDALKVISLLEERGIIGPPNDKGVREVLIEDNLGG